MNIKDIAKDLKEYVADKHIQFVNKTCNIGKPWIIIKRKFNHG